MCGIAGFVDWSKTSGEDELLATAARMTDTLQHRGPDDQGVWCCAEDGVALGHRRLSILDLSPQGRQPMHSKCGRFVLVFNGEIYNFQKLRRELESLGHSFAGTSDTEVLLVGIQHWGVDPTVRRCSGMFALAVWDRHKRTLHLVRDRVGEKPLYCGQYGNTVVFGSELKAIRQHPAWNDEVDRDSLSQLLQFGYIAGTRCIYQRVKKVQPGTIVTLRQQSVSARAYWSLKQVVEEGMEHPFRDTPAAAVDHLDEVLQEIVSEQLIADVPVGALLSGGVDSSLVVSIAQAASSRPLRTFTIRFQEDAFDEGEIAKNVSRQLETDHTELHVTPNDAISLIPRLPHIYDEPLADSSQIPTYFVCQLARRHVTVALSGDGGDESFAGYNRYRRGQRLWRLWRRLPNSLRSVSSRMLLRNDSAGLRKLGNVLRADESQSFYRAMISRWPYELELVPGSGNACTVLPNTENWANVPDFMPRMQYLDTATYLPDDILAKVDRAGMAVSLESRLPLVDHRCIEFAWTLPAAMKINGRDSKWILRQVLKKRLPQVTIPRAKRGFSVPIATWLRGPLRDWAESLLDPGRLASEGFLHADRIRSLWDQHLRGQQNWHDLLWGVLMFQGWHEEQRQTTSSRTRAA